MSSNPNLTRVDRAERHRRMVSDYRGGMSSRAVGERYGLNDSHVRAVMRLHGVSRRVGRPAV